MGGIASSPVRLLLTRLSFLLLHRRPAAGDHLHSTTAAGPTPSPSFFYSHRSQGILPLPLSLLSVRDVLCVRGISSSHGLGFATDSTGDFIPPSLVKILKKYDKKTEALIRQPFIEKVLHSHSLQLISYIYKLVKECVAMLDHLFPSNNLSISAECDGQNGVPKPAQSGGRVPELEEIKYM
ncbi:hypothetical protein ZIOFF_051471 [Zingiber officinale]|uniref:Uncharacterized protein n=1 Tax=Zingiber officinale TaxID=94328 RepID=A0A8J5KN00_ZINOF|nr:hypothetical protein ZIOFF_051471 [Zingiber officinale]